MLLPDGHRLVYPGFIVNGPEKDTIFILMDVEALLALRNSDKTLSHPTNDLPPGKIGWWHVKPRRLQKIKWWYYEKNRLLKMSLLLNNDYRITFCAPKEYKKYLSDEDLHWLKALVDSADWSVRQDGEKRKIADLEMTKRSEPIQQQKPKKKKVKAKYRRKRQKSKFAEADYG